MTKHRFKKHTFFILPLATLVILVSYLILNMSFGPANKILPGVYLMDLNLSNMDRHQALRAVQQLQNRLSQPVTLKYQDMQWTLPLKRIGLKLDARAEVQRAMDIGRYGSPWRKFVERRQAHRGIHLKPQIYIDTNLLEQVVAEATEAIILPPRDAGLVINADDSVEVSPGHAGRLVDVDKLRQDLIHNLLQGNREPIELKLIEVAPGHSTEEVKAMGVDTLLGSYSTHFDPNMVNRTYNISVAAAALDGLTISPHEVVSFNDVVGPRSTEAGYKSAPVIINNELVDDFGGGVCQVSTTLYNAVLLSNLEIVERTNHSIPIQYVPIGRDATVVFDAVDFKFRNNTDYWLYIQSYVSDNTLYIKIFGNSRYKREVVVRSWIEETYNPETVIEKDYSIKAGDRVVKQKGMPGYRVAAERVVMQDGRVIKTEKLPSSIYKARNEIISEGMAEPGAILSNQDLNE